MFIDANHSDVGVDMDGLIACHQDGALAGL